MNFKKIRQINKEDYDCVYFQKHLEIIKLLNFDRSWVDQIFECFLFLEFLLVWFALLGVLVLVLELLVHLVLVILDILVLFRPVLVFHLENTVIFHF